MGSLSTPDFSVKNPLWNPAAAFLRSHDQSLKIEPKPFCTRSAFSFALF
jgi:hypothetical protein